MSSAAHCWRTSESVTALPDNDDETELMAFEICAETDAASWSLPFVALARL